MKLEDISRARRMLLPTQKGFHSELFCDDIWGDNGTDSAVISIQAETSGWKLHYIRTQSGIPYPFAEHTSRVIDEYEKELSDEQLYDYLLLHNLQKEFEAFCQ